MEETEVRGGNERAPGTLCPHSFLCILIQPNLFLFSLIEFLRLTSADDKGTGNGYRWRHQSGVGSGIF